MQSDVNNQFYAGVFEIDSELKEWQKIELRAILLFTLHSKSRERTHRTQNMFSRGYCEGNPGAFNCFTYHQSCINLLLNLIKLLIAIILSTILITFLWTIPSFWPSYQKSKEERRYLLPVVQVLHYLCVFLEISHVFPEIFNLDFKNK